MSKIIESPVKKFPGTVTVPDDLDYSQGVKYVTAYREAKALGEAATMIEFVYTMMPAICYCVEKWELTGLPSQVTPEVLEKAKPGRAVAALMSWLFQETTVLYSRTEVPND